MTRQTIDAAEAQRRWADILSWAARHRMRVIVAEAGVPVAALIPVADLERLDALDAEHAHPSSNAEHSHDAAVQVERATAAALSAVESARQLQEELLARRGGEPFPSSFEILDEIREERSRHLP